MYKKRTSEANEIGDVTDSLVSLNDAAIGCSVHVRSIGADKSLDRLIELGIYPGQQITVMHRVAGGAIMACVPGCHAVVMAAELARDVTCERNE